jgi:molybdopterin molybdotransferase
MIDPCSLEPKRLLNIEEALASIKSAIQPVADVEQVALDHALGRVLAGEMLSPINIPYAQNSAMDGYAISSKDIDADKPFSLNIAGTSWAGKPYQGELASGQCVRIFTGAVLPDGADSVVIQEQVVSDERSATFPANCAAFQNVREAGEDIRTGGLLCASPKKLTPVDLGLLASAGISDVPVFRKLKIVIFSTGDELTGIGQPLGRGKIYDSNRYTLAGLLNDPCFNVVDLGAIPDDKHLLENTLRDAAQTADMIITTGGVSVGEADYIKDILAKYGEVNFWKISIKPGKPLAFGKIGQSYFFGLPGNPVSAIVTFQRMVAPALMQLSGRVIAQPLRVLALCTNTLKKAPGRQEFQRGILSQDSDGSFFVALAGSQGAHILSSMSRSNCFIVLSKECSGVNQGEKVWVEPFNVWL